MHHVGVQVPKFTTSEEDMYPCIISLVASVFFSIRLNVLYRTHRLPEILAFSRLSSHVVCPLEYENRALVMLSLHIMPSLALERINEFYSYWLFKSLSTRNMNIPAT